MLFIRRKQIVLSLLLAILLSLTGNISFQAEGKEEPLSQYYGPRDGIEIEELRTETSKQYLLPDGTMQYIGSPDRIHWKDENGQYIDIDNTIIETAYNVNGLLYSHKNKSSDFSLFFANSSMENEFPIRIEYQEYAFSYGIEGSQFNYVFGEETSFPEILLENVCLENAVMYQGDEGYDLVYIPKNIGEKEYIIIYGPMETSSFVFQLRLEGLIPVQMEREVVLINEDGNPVFEMGDLFAMDSNNIYCDDVQAELLGFYEETATISINVNQNWMNDDNRVYPILIDPTYTICGEFVTADSYVSSVDANVNFYLSDYLRMGKDDDYGIRRTYIRFDNLPSILSTNLTSACINIRLYSSSGSLSTIRASTITSSWDSDSITWNNTPSISNMYLSGYLAPDTWHDTTNWYTLDVTTIVGRWLGGLQTNYGVKISDDVENSTSHWSTFYSSDSGYPNRPELMINYTSSTSYSWNAVQVGPNDGSLDHSSFMDPIKTYLQGRGYTVSNQKGKFTPANINSFLSGGTYSIFIVKANEN